MPIAQDHVQQGVDFVLRQAQVKFKCTSVDDLSLVEILETYEKLVQDDSIAQRYLPQQHRSQVYLALLKFKKDREEQ